MSKAALGARSNARLNTCAPALQRVVRRAEKISPIDFTVLEGLRSLERQQELYASGRTDPGPVRTHLDGINRRSRHQANANGESEAIDLAPYPLDWGDQDRFMILAGVILAAAEIEGVALRWGGDWDGDGQTADNRFDDLPHFELKG